jgi:hypothetical protein
MPILDSSSNVCSHARHGFGRVRSDSCHGRPRPVSPSLASSRRCCCARGLPGRGARHASAVGLEWDGMRAQLRVDRDGTWCVRSRPGARLLRAVPRAGGGRTALAGRAVVLDGELACLDPAGRSRVPAFAPPAVRSKRPRRRSPRGRSSRAASPTFSASMAAPCVLVAGPCSSSSYQQRAGARRTPPPFVGDFHYWSEKAGESAARPRLAVTGAPRAFDNEIARMLQTLRGPWVLRSRQGVQLGPASACLRASASRPAADRNGRASIAGSAVPGRSLPTDEAEASAW